jgi:outer membrane cobalamin receptor
MYRSRSRPITRSHRLAGAGWTALLLCATPCLAPASATIIAAPAIQAQEAPGDTVDVPRRDSIVAVSDIVVTATRTEQKILDLPVSVTVLDKVDIDLSASKTVDEFLRRVVGFNLSRQASSVVSHPGGQALNMRGLGASSASRTLVLVNGLPLNDPFGGWIHWSSIPLQNVQRVEVVKGGSSGIWGNRALGGVINIITEMPTRTGMTVSAQGGSYTTFRGFGSGTYKSDRLGVLVGGEVFDTGGYPVVPEEQRGLIDGNATSKHVTLGGMLEYAASESLDLYFNGSYFKDDQNLGTPERQNGMEIGALRAGADLSVSSGSWRFNLFGRDQTHFNRIGSASPDRSSETPTLDQFDVPSTSIGTNLQWSKTSFGSHQLAGGLDFQWIEGETNEHYVFVNGDFTRRREAGGQQQLGGVYVQDLFPLGAKWRMQASGRLNLWRSYGGTRVETQIQTEEIRLDESYPKRTEWRFNYTLGTRYLANDRLSLRASFYTGFRAPTLNELYKPFRASGGVVAEANPGLDPEDLIGTDIGADYQISRVLTGRVTAFWNLLENAIAEATIGLADTVATTIEPCGRVPANGVCRQRDNLGTLRSVGFETELEYAPHVFWLFGASYLFNPTEVLEAPGRPEVEGSAVPRSPENQFVVRATYANPAIIEGSILGRYVGTRFEDDLNQLEQGAFFTIDLQLSRLFFEHLEAFLSVENLLDVDYQIAVATNGLIRHGAPRLIHIGLRVGL